MLAQKFETKILKDGIIKLPDESMFKKDTEVEVIVLEKIKGEKKGIKKSKKLTPVAFYKKWEGSLSQVEDNYRDYIENKNK